MNNLMLQYWHDIDNPGERFLKLGYQHAIATVKQYAARIGADYEMMTGETEFYNPKMYAHYMNKLSMFSERFDKYDQVCFVDCDLIINPDSTNIFEVEDGCGYSDSRTQSFRKMYGAWALKFDREERIKIREQLIAGGALERHAYENSGDELALDRACRQSNHEIKPFSDIRFGACRGFNIYGHKVATIPDMYFMHFLTQKERIREILALWYGEDYETKLI